MKVEIKDRIRELRTETGLTQQELADKMHFCLNTISRWETGVKEPSLQSIKLLARFFDVSTDYLLDMDNFHPKFEK